MIQEKIQKAFRFLKREILRNWRISLTLSSDMGPGTTRDASRAFKPREVALSEPGMA